ncbi:ATP-binding protein [Saccharicrinis fermentans]|uniref:histidine kinase n=1 Tax=Saccharicrinis fermentans DSM 9555 = JCM 21142 TaxID=869213 RepID=W7YEA7_9BACT|nr:ATP-binding protein [Saccharicrinis fermentans]GAF02801.1 sensor protein EvgS precursor [Saccharicrinis fermentans DSM 9555 = JCM 21142]
MTTEKSKTIRRINVWVKRKLGPTTVPSGGGFHYWRERVFHYFTLALIAIGLVAYLYYTLSFLQDENYVAAISSSLFFLSVLFTGLVRTLPFRIRVFWIAASVYLLGGFLFVENGPASLGLVLLLSYSVLSGMMLGRRGSVNSIFFNGLLFLVVGVVGYLGLFQVKLLQEISFAFYINLCVLFVFVNIITLFPMVSFINGMRFSFEKEHRYQHILGREREKLMRAIVKAEESDVLKNSFLSNMSHEIRTPMNAILGFSNLLSHKEISNPEKEEFVNLINLNVKNLLTIVEDLIDISKIDSGQLQIRNSAVCLHEVLDDVYTSFYKDIQRRGQMNIKLYLKEGIADRNTMILTDGARLKQVLVNLVGNGIKFTDRGFVEFGYELKNEEVLQFYVKDTGIGLPVGKEDRIFERFYKFSEGRQTLYGGTGIGLSLVKDLLDLMGGKIWIESEPNIGTTFYFTIPYHKVRNVKAKYEIQKKDNVYNWEGKTFLIAEDEEDNFRYLEVALSISNASLIWARTGAEAVDIFNRIDNIDLVLMDIKMPEMDGYDATREIKKQKRNVPVIAQTAYAMSEEREKSILAGCDDYIAKPIGYESLLKTIHKYVPGTEETLI